MSSHYIVEYEVCVDNSESHNLKPTYVAKKASFVVNGTIEEVYKRIAIIDFAARHDMGYCETVEQLIRDILDLKIRKRLTSTPQWKFDMGYFLPRNWKIYIKQDVELDQSKIDSLNQDFQKILDMIE